MRDIIKKITVVIEGVANTNGIMDYLVDQEEDEIAHNMFVPGNMIAIYGSKIKVAGDNPGNGVYFVPVDDPTKAVKMKRIGDNNPTRITGIAPDPLAMHSRIEIRTQYSANKTFLKEQRVITSGFTIESL